MIGGLATLLLFQLLGEVIVIVLRLPVPGLVVGMLLLFLALLWRGRSRAWAWDSTASSPRSSSLSWQSY